jgi:tetratricopeptide (TPR) repeat protein
MKMPNAWTIVAAAGLAIASPAAAQQAQPPAPTIQQQFDAASAALMAENWEEAVRQYEALEARLARVGNARSLAIVRVRKASALLRLQRRNEAAEALRLGLPVLPASDATLNEDRFVGHVALGQIAELGLDYRAAIAHYRAAKAIEVEPALRLDLFRGLIQSQMFFDPAAALADADDALRVAAAGSQGARALEGQFRTMRGRVLLNMGRLAEAREELERALRLLGGLTTRVNVPDIVARSDLAIASAVAGNQEAARRYLAYTGAGNTVRASLPTSGRMEPPPCGNGLVPGDVGVVELSIREDGTVGHASPIYSSRQGEPALLFARAAMRWRFPTAEARRLHPVFRTAIRVELRCTLRSGEGDEPALWEVAQAERWSAAHGVGLELNPPLDRTAEQLRADLAAAEARFGAAAPQLLEPLVRLGHNGELRPRERVGHLRRALAIAAAARAPSSYLARIALKIAEDEHEASSADSSEMPDFRRLLADPAIAGDAGAAAAVQLSMANWLYQNRRWSEAADVLTRVRGTPGLGPDHPLMPAVLDQLAAIEAGRGDDAAATAAWGAIPASAPRCTVPAARLPLSVSSNDFPRSAVEWGFEGMVNIETLVGRGGAVGPPRTVFAYPPFVFNRGGEELAARIRYAPAFVPPEGPCVVFRQRFRFELPG